VCHHAFLLILSNLIAVAGMRGRITMRIGTAESGSTIESQGERGSLLSISVALRSTFVLSQSASIETTEKLHQCADHPGDCRQQ
jgi:hypothetical protein